MSDQSSPPNPQAPAPSESPEDWLKAGELLVAADLISKENLDSCVMLATKMRMPLGRMLAMNGYLTESVLCAALKIQEKVSSKQMSQQAGIGALQTVKEGGQIAVDDLIKKPRAALTNNQPLGETLRAVGAITAKQLKTALALSVETGLPVGWVLASQGTINQSLLVSAITAQRLCDRNLIGQDDALNYLRMARMQQKPIRKLLKENNVSTQEVDTELLLGHLLVESGVLVRTELLAAQEFALLSNKDLGPMLLDLGMLEKKAWNTAEAVFARVIGASIPTAQAIELLHKLKRLDWNMDQLASPEDGASPIELGELIGLAGLVPAEKLQSAIESSRQGHRTLATFLTDDALIEAGILAIVEKCKSAIESRLLNLQKAVILLTYCSDNRCSLEEALAQFGWTMA